MSDEHDGVEDLLKDDGLFEKAQSQTVKEVLAWKLAEGLKKQKLANSKLAATHKKKRAKGRSK